MDLFFSSISDEGRRNLSVLDPLTDHCLGWSGVTCVEDVIVKVKYTKLLYGNFNIRALPPTVTFLQVFACQQKYALETRTLPRAAETVWLHRNRLFGSVELRTLPPRLCWMSLLRNELRGPIILTNLPFTLQSLQIGDNKIRQDIVYYANLPPSIRMIDLMNIRGRTPINEIRALNPAEAVTDKSIFSGFPANRID
ncbi:leucine-rich repeat protein [Perkinsela sp. CCAP 1560/4]|nr:leucine-rich repeat protein [Perkinsela sp. CCAP 1560/4]|eukprot:KNH07177.1 leucine-rich repeat protein [Perkinsela sp. CCAP 1560/4]